jgi:hypothetical protein
MTLSDSPNPLPERNSESSMKGQAQEVKARSRQLWINQLNLHNPSKRGQGRLNYLSPSSYHTTPRKPRPLPLSPQPLLSQKPNRLLPKSLTPSLWIHMALDHSLLPVVLKLQFIKVSKFIWNMFI